MKNEQSTISLFAEDILRDYGSFMEEHDSAMKSLKNEMLSLNTVESVTLVAMTSPIELNYGSGANARFCDTSVEESELVANKPLKTLANLCNQCRDLSLTAKQYQLAFLFNDSQLGDGRLPAVSDTAGLERCLHRMSSAIDFFCQVYFLLKRIIVMVQTLWKQISASGSMPLEISEVHLFTVFDAMTELLEDVVVFNEISDQSKIAAKWTLYKKWLAALSNSKQTSDQCSSMELNGLLTSLDDIETVITGNLFGILLNSLLELKKQFTLKDINHINQHSNAYIRKIMLEIEANHGNDYKNYEDPKNVIRLTALVAVLHELGIQMEGKLIKSVLDVASRHKRLALNQSVCWSPSAFLARHAKTLIKTPPQAKPQDNHKSHHALMEKTKLSDQKKCRHLGTQICLWTIHVQRVFAAGVFGKLQTFSQLILRGQSYADQVNLMMDSLINRHVALTTPLSKSEWFTVCRLLQYLRVLQKTFESNEINVMRLINSLVQWQKQKVFHLLLSTKRKIVDLKLLQRKMNIFSTIKLAERSILGFPSKKRLTFVNLALSEFLEKDRLLPVDMQRQFQSILLRINNLSDFQRNIKGQFDSTSLMYNYCFISTSLLKEYTEQQRNPYSLQNIIAVTNQLDKTLGIFGRDGSSKQSACDLANEFLKTHLEFFLRVEALSHLFLNQDQPFQTNLLDYRSCVNVEAMEFQGDYSVMRDNLENYFTETFYNLTTIAPHDWKTYEKMRHFADKVLQLCPIDDHLPNQIIDQGIDVLQIMRNIHTFASSYAYNMNLQIFVEMQSKSKHLDIIGTRHVANSVQTHGTGIINTTVNFIYQFLRQKFYTFSTFLHDEQIKSRLLKELRYHSEHKHTNESYPYERADTLLKKIKKLGLSGNGETYMDLFRKVITQVGNSVGYVRLLQAGSKSANYKSRSYMSRFHSSLVCGGTKTLHETTESAIKEYEKSVGHMKKCYSDSTNYFKLLLQGFQPFLCNPNNHHLKTFYLIAPALIMNYIDYRVKEKLKIHKKDLAKFSLFEDGFAIGLIYILTMLNQLGEFHELGWSQTTKQQMELERSKVRDILAGQQSTDPVDEKLLQTVAITERHVNAYEHEYNLLYATLSSAEIFFQ
ncbi:WASH complex subunit 4 isoform X1 [Drosophila pseudoobscura]|uniref:WASH complex subunit 4 isoform X1 n=1 Tax=Drosophila pseudoobscura pseudoobscura TaxID=46245 RepID=A0A6I8UGH2_DROPS|nr:WASH complex subunit 4 isoform X1 [Drosophila pseudoobscura]